MHNFKASQSQYVPSSSNPQKLDHYEAIIVDLYNVYIMDRKYAIIITLQKDVEETTALSSIL